MIWLWWWYWMPSVKIETKSIVIEVDFIAKREIKRSVK